MATAFTWRDLIRDWCEAGRHDAPADVPRPLAEFWMAGGARALSLQNRFEAPADDDGYSVFYVENQHACEWAYRTGDPSHDPAVYVREPAAPNSEWVAVGCQLDAFLTAASVIELGWPQVITSYYTGPDLVAFTHDVGGHAYAFIGARQPAALHEIDERIRASPHWELT